MYAWTQRKVGTDLIWIKRLVPIVIIAAVTVAYLTHSRRQAEARAEREQKMALVTAQVWVASAKLRASPEEFLRFRDSLLDACSLNISDVVGFVKADSGQPEELNLFSKLVKEYVDSLLEIEDSLAMISADSSDTAGSVSR